MSTIDWQTYNVAKAVRADGCKATTVAGVVRWAKARGIARDRVEDIFASEPAGTPFGASGHRRQSDGITIDRTGHRWTRCAIHDEELAEKASETSKRLFPHRKNWTAPKAVMGAVRGDSRWVFFTRPAFDKVTNNEGRYSSRCSYTHYTYTPTYQSSVRVYRSGKTVELWQSCRMVRRVTAPAGLRFGSDKLGVRIIAPDGTDYHPTVQEWRATNFAAVIRAALTAKRKAIRAAAAATRETARIAAIRERQMATARVTLDDSRRAGNCVEGSLVFAERRLGMDRREIVAGGHLVHVSAAKLLVTGDHRARRAVEVAWQRETMVCI